MAYKDKEKEKAAKLRHYYKNKQQYIDRNKLRQEKLKEYLKNIKLNSCCSKCTESHIACLDFHHIDKTTKKSSVANIVKSGQLNLLKEEIKKCIILCSNCHRKLHFNKEN